MEVLKCQGNGKISLEDSQGITKIPMGFYKHWIRIQVPQLRTKQMIDEPDPGCKYWPALSPVVALYDTQSVWVEEKVYATRKTFNSIRDFYV